MASETPTLLCHGQGGGCCPAVSQLAPRGNLLLFHRLGRARPQRGASGEALTSPEHGKEMKLAWHTLSWPLKSRARLQRGGFQGQSRGTTSQRAAGGGVLRRGGWCGAQDAVLLPPPPCGFCPDFSISGAAGSCGARLPGLGRPVQPLAQAD